MQRSRSAEKRAEIEEQLDIPPKPEALDYLWSAYWRIRRRRGGNGFGASPIEWADIDAYSRLSGLRYAPWEVEIIEALDDLWLASVAATKGKGTFERDKRRTEQPETIGRGGS